MPKQPTDDLFEKSTMTFGEHLEELRVCLFRSVIGLAFGCVIGFFIANWVVRFFQSPLERAMEQYYIDKAVDDFRPMYEKAYRTRLDKVPLEVERMIIDEGIIPEPIQIEPGRIAATLGREYPQQIGDPKISAYWFTPGDFLSDGELQLCRDLDAAKDRSSTAAGRIWQFLDDDQRKLVSDMAQSGLDLTVDQTAQLLAILNDVASKRELHDSPEFAAISGPDADFASTWLTKLWGKLGYREPSQTDTAAVLRKEISEQFDSEKSRRLNKLLLARVFPDCLRKARLNLIPLLAWKPVKVRFQVLNAQEAFMIWMKAAIVTGLVIASPYLFFQIWNFVAAGLYPHEKNYVYLYLPISIGLFLGGASLAFAFVFDPVLRFLFTFNKGMNADFDPRVGEWLSFVLILPLGFGISFQLPLVMLFLNRIGVASLDFYIQQWRIAILIICIISMVLTPADPISMLLMAVPLCFLYLLGIVMCKYMPTGKSPFAEAYEP
jgi:sec-independent protein translocase protein TatC